MSYCRFSPDSDVYLYPGYKASFICSDCKLMRKQESLSFIPATFYAFRFMNAITNDFITGDRKEILEHLKLHQHVGHKVPKNAIEEIKHEWFYRCFRFKKFRFRTWWHFYSGDIKMDYAYLHDAPGKRWVTLDLCIFGYHFELQYDERAFTHI